MSDFDVVVKVNGNDPNARWKRAVAFQMATQFKRSLLDFNDAIRLDPREPEYYPARRRIRQPGRHDKAAEDLAISMRMHPDDPDDLIRRGDSWFYQRAYEHAVRDYANALRIDPGNAEAYFRRAYARLFQKDYDRAIGDLNHAVRLDAKKAEYLGLRATAWMLKEEYALAIADFDAAFRVDPERQFSFDLPEVPLFVPHRQARLFRGLQIASNDHQLAWDLSAYSAIMGYFAARREGGPNEARELLDASVGRLP